MDKVEQLIQQFINEGLSAIRDLKLQNDSLSRDMTDIKVSVSTIKEQISGLGDNFSKGMDRLERENNELKKKVEDNRKTISEMEKDIAGLKSNQNSKYFDRVLSELAEVEKRTGKLETQQNKWLGALTVVGVVVGFLIAVTKGWLTGLIG